MAIYTAILPNGQPYKIRGPEGASTEDIQAAGEQIYLKQNRTPYVDSGRRNYTLGQAGSKAVSRGMERVKSTFGDVIPAMVGNALGADEYAKRQMYEAQASEALINREYTPEIKSYKDVQGLGDAIKFGIETIGEQLPNLGVMAVPGVAAGQVAKIGASKLAAGALAKRQATAQGIGVYLGSYSLNAPEVFKNIYDETGELSTGTSLLFGAAAASLDSVLPATILKNITPLQKLAISKAVIKKSGARPGLVESVFKGLAKGAATEGVTEGMQEAISIAAENFVGGNPQIFDSEDWDRIMESSVRGAVAGGGFRGASAPFERPSAEPTIPPVVTEPEIEVSSDVVAEVAKAAPTAEVTPKVEIVPNRLKTLRENNLINQQAAQAVELGLEIQEDGTATRFEPVDPQDETAGEQEVTYNIINNRWEKQDESTTIDATEGIETPRGSDRVSVEPESPKDAPAFGESDRGEVGVDTDTVPPTGGGENVSDVALSPENITAEQQWDEMSVSGVPFSELGKEDQLRLIEAQQEGELTGQLVDEIDASAQDTFAGITFVKEEDGKYGRYKSKEGFIDKRTGLPQGGPEYIESVSRQDDNLSIESRTETESTGQTTETVTTELVEEFGNNVNKTIEKGKLVIIDDVSQLPANIEMSSTANGAYDPTTQTSYIVANRIQKGKARRVLLHEIGEHYGLEKMVGKDYMSLLNRLKTLRKQNAEVQTIFDEVQRQYPELEVDSKPFLQEVMAKVGESAPNNTLFRRMVGAVKNFLRRLGLYNVNNFNDSDIQDMILNSLRVSLAEATGTVTREQASGIPAVQMSKEEGPGAFKAAQEAATRLLGLPPDNTAMDRAKAMGYNVDKVYYHGTNQTFNAFNPALRGSNFGPDSAGAREFTWFVDNPDVASGYAAYGSVDAFGDVQPSGNQVYPVFIKDGKGLELDVGGQSYEDVSQDIKQLLKNTKDYDTVTLLNLKDDVNYINDGPFSPPSTHIGVKNSANIRSINAAFNPENETSSDIMFSKADTSDVAEIIDLGGVDPKEGNSILSRVNNYIQNLPIAQSGMGRDVISWGSKLSDKAAGAYVSLLSIPNKIELFGDELPALKKIATYLQDKANIIKSGREEVNAVIRDGKELQEQYNKTEKGKKIWTEWNTVLFNLSKENINPETIINDPEARAELERPVNKDGAGNAFYNEKGIDLIARYEKLPKDLRDLGNQVVNDMKGRYNILLETMVKAFPSAEESIRARFETLNYYLPMVRRGNYWFKYLTKEGEEGKSSADSPFLRKQMQAKLREQGATQFENFTPKEVAKISGSPPAEFVANVTSNIAADKTLDADAKEAAIKVVETAYNDLFPEQSLRNQETHRRGIPGYINDIMFAYAETAPKIIASTANAQYNTDLINASNEVSGEAAQSESAIVRAIGRDTIKSVPFYLNPVANIFASIPAYASYVWFIGGNISSAFVNLTQLPLIVMPFLQGEYGFDNSQKALFDAIKLYTNGGFEENRDFLPDRTAAPFKIDPKTKKKIYRDKEFAEGGKYHNLFKDAERAAALRRGIGYEITELKKNLGDSVGSGLELKSKAEAAVGYVFQNSERVNREVTLMAAFDLEMKFGSKNEAIAIQKAIELTSKVHSHALPEMGPRLFQDGLGKVTFVFKRFAQAQVYLISKLFKDVFAAKPKNKAEKDARDIAARQLIGVYGYSFLMAGVQGMPFYGAVTVLASLLLDDEDEPFDVHTVVNQSIGNIAYRGPLSQLLGVDISQRTGFRDLVFREDPARLEKIGAAAYMLEVIGGPGYSVARRGLEGIGMVADGEIGRGAERILPTAMGNALKTVRYNTDGMTNRYGAPIIEGNPSVYESFMQILGFTNIELSEAYTEANALKGPERKLQQRKSRLLLKYFLAKQTGDVGGMESIQKDINRFNNRAPVSFRITPKKLSLSMKAREKRVKDSVNGVYQGSNIRADLSEKYLKD